MALTKEQKATLMEVYKDKIGKASNVVLLEQSGIPVDQVDALRMNMDETGGQMLVVKKRLFLMSSADSGCDDSGLGKIDGNLTVLFANEDKEFAPLKLVYKTNKQYKKDKAEYGFKYLGGWYDKVWKDAAYVEEMAALPTKEELVGKFLFLLKYPIQSVAAVLKQVGEKLDDGTAAPAPEATEAPAAETTEEPKASEATEEATPEATAPVAPEGDAAPEATETASEEVKEEEKAEEAPEADAAPEATTEENAEAKDEEKKAE